MEASFATPNNWVSNGSGICPDTIRELQRRRRTRDVAEALAFQPCIMVRAPHLWTDQLLYIRLQRLRVGHALQAYGIIGQILCQVLAVPRDCKRVGPHKLTFFTNYRAIQIYCCHTSHEEQRVKHLFRQSFRYLTPSEDPRTDGITYHQATDSIFEEVRKYLAWECIYPEGVDMEALSPRDANAHIRVKQTLKSKMAPVAAKMANSKEKDHPPPPPSEVHEPPSSDRPNGAIYKTGKCLGKGGFAICYDGQLAGTKKKYALKIVKSHMPQKKMEQKFQTELQIHSKMNHANIVQFHRAFSYEKCTYIVLELCPNGSLMDMVKKRKFITEPEVRFWTVQMAGAIKYMHSKGIIHRDLKMGNIFLDKDMNVKVGDFGLAALLMSGKDWQACRRTTLCGTPNYIAPEILSKDKGGHDHAVDIWSLGIIIFAMLTGKPPFQSATADEIYRRAREREYDWPKLDTSENFISEETKDLVTDLLQAPDKRPDPDTIVQHPFFTCGWVPQTEEMTPSLREKHPEPHQFLSVGMRGGRTNLYTKNLKKLCMKCDVGPWTAKSKQYTSTYREVADEEKAGLTPAVPLPEDIVYRPFHEVLEEESRQFLEQSEVNSKPQSVLDKILSPVRSKANEVPIVPIKPITQSFAAQQRAKPQVPTAGPTGRLPRTRQPVPESSSRPMLTLNPRGRPRKVEPAEPEKVIDVEDRLAADLVEQLNKAEAERKSTEDAPTISLNVNASLFNPQEKLEAVPNTRPDHILAGLKRFQAELERALNSRTTAIETKHENPATPIIVVKWVDYTNKFGLGYILSNGSVGCIFKPTPAYSDDESKGHIPPTCVLVRDAERHLQNRNNVAYIDRLQVVPVSGPNIEFYENRAEKGIFRGKVNPQNFKVAINAAGEPSRITRGRDEWDNRKREKIVLWKKFANYMTAFGRDQNYPFDEALARSSPERSTDNVAPGNVVTFYQRFGDVGCWLFCDGHFQFNFPDHTKIILSADGTWCDLYHLPLEAARDLAVNGTISASALDDRRVLSYPVQTLLNFMSKPSRVGKSTTRKRPEIDPMIQGIPQANEFRKKIDFIKSVVNEWTTNGGIGLSDTSIGGRLRWNGMRELINVKVPYKHVWVTVGGRGSDERKVAWFNPRKADELIPDIE
ncbi:related to protein kinase CDC5 [Rhynchosporium agropyri]|uniref:Serine/threonine-protein kinase ATG1 n=1 Tax=Rhynchosporium agropyri TaxID=914238 RepID=A0A1E1KJX9_9HELO|nr:related to protein kinase CDC5 [Rhynchosporium agropyri]